MRHPNRNDIDESINKLQAKFKNIAKLFDELNTLKKSFFIIDVYKLERLISKSKESKK